MVNPEEGPCVMNLEDEVPPGSCSTADRYSAPPTISSQQVKEYMEADIPSGSNVFTSGKKKSVGMDIYPVSPLAFGEGLPYAPVDWPNPGDIWSWKVGKRVNKSGRYLDRYLFLPRHLQRPRCWRQGFSSKCSVRKYIQEVDPEVDVAAFFESFSWRVPSKGVPSSPITSGVSCQSKKEVNQEEEKKIPYTFPRSKRKRGKLPVTTTYRRCTRQSTKWIHRVNVVDTGIIDLCSLSKESGRSDPANQDLRSSTDFECDEVSSHQSPISLAVDFERDQVSRDQAHVSPASNLECDQVCSSQALISPAGSSVPHNYSPVSCGVAQMEVEFNRGQKDKVIPEDFENYIKSLDDMLAQPLPEGASSPLAMDSNQVSEDEFAEAQTKLSSLLAMDFHLLVSSSKDLEELALLSSKLQKDPRLNADQLAKLKLIDEIPVIGKDFLETMQIVKEVDRSLAELDSNREMATSLRNEYNASKELIGMLQAEILSSLSNIKEVDDQLAELQLRRAELSTSIENKRREIARLTTTQAMVADSLPKVVHKVQLGNSKKPEWEQKKKNGLKRQAEVLGKATPLRKFANSFKNAGFKEGSGKK